MIRIVLDTNVLLVSLSDRSPYHLIFRAFLDRQYSLCVSTEILAEYAEILATHANQNVATNTLETLESAENVVFITRFFAFDLIKADPDDNKFVDCAIAANADYIVTNDTHFNILATIAFPSVSVMNSSEFMLFLEKTSV
jgi:uncharacterized protein